MNQIINIETLLKQLKQKLYDLSGRNPFVNVNPKKLWLIDSINSDQAKKIYKKQHFFKKEYGLDTVLLVTHFIRWKSPHKNNFYTSPLLYKPAKLIKNQKIKLNFEWDFQSEINYINPIIIDEFKTLFDIDLKIENETIEKFISDLVSILEQNGDLIQTTQSLNDNNNWQIITLNALGNFNYKKSVLAQDYQIISDKINSSVANLLGYSEGIPKNTEIQNINLPLSDASQKQAILKSLQTNLVIQGPPGTGKSHTIVELIKQNLLVGKKVLFVSEKKSALDVVYHKLANENLTHLIAYFNAEKNQKKIFYQHLKQSISNLPKLDKNQRLNNLEFDELNLFFKSYSQHLPESNQERTSLYTLVKYLAKNQVTSLEFDTKTKIPNYDEWYKYLPFFEDIEAIAIKNYDVSTISELPFIHFNKSAFIGEYPLPKIETRLDELSNWQVKISYLLKKYNLNWTWSELNKYCIAASVLQIANKAQLSILDPNDKAFKAFNTWSKKYELTKNKLNQSSLLCEKWIKTPKLADIDSLISHISNQKKTKWITFFKPSIVDMVFKNYDGYLTADLKIKALENVKTYYNLTHELNTITLKLKYNLDILNPDTEIDLLLRLRQKLNSLNPNHYVFILEHSQSVQLINDLHQLHPKIQQTNQIVKFLFTNYKIESLHKFNKNLSQIRKESAKFIHFVPEIKKTLSIPNDLLNFIKSNTLTISKLTDIVVYHNYIEAVRCYPVLKQLESIEILPNFNLLKNIKNEKNSGIINSINCFWHDKSNKLDNLLLTPTSKLNNLQKLKKKNIKIAKRIIYHEIAKQQQHLPIKSLVKQTSYSIFDTLPLWIMNPLTIAENLPCNADLFDVVIFDESSQIPLEDAIPAIYRAKQIIVVGDDKQMPPSQFFSSSLDNSITLLDQANSVFKSQLLTWHYRSQHPKLMQFSNTNFYDNELCYFPAVNSNNPIEHIFVNNGVFNNGINNIEAKKVVEQYQKIIQSGIKNVGIIAFSLAQEEQIKKELFSLNLIENDELLIRNLENVQGIERDVIIISIGYGFNSDGDFRLNFGPINQEFGANRLNVLLTRAKQKMIICSSIKSSDFKLSENKGVQLLRDFLIFSEKQSKLESDKPHQFLLKIVSNLLIKSTNITFYKAINGLAINCFIQHSTQKILLIDPCLNTDENNDIYTVLSILNERFKSIKILLSHDYWHNKDRFITDINTFFNTNV